MRLGNITSYIKKPAAGCLIIAFLVSACSIPIYAGVPYWEKKDWTKWSWNDCDRLLGGLTGSPWAHAQGSSITGYEDTLHLSQTVYFRSALPIRLALARLEQINQKYDKMDPSQREDFDQRIQKEYLTDGASDVVIVHVKNGNYNTGKNAPAAKQDAAQLCELNFGGARSFVSSQPQSVKMDEGSLQYDVTFPRLINGEPLIKPTDKKFTVTCGYEVQFDASKMVFKGKLEY